MTQPICLLVCALGGEGGGVLSEWLVDAAKLAGYPAQSTSIPGVAQRTGATTYYVEVLPLPLSQLQGRRPIFSLNPVPGALDALVSSELLETTRQIALGYASPACTQVITSSSRSFTTAERMQLADGRLDSAQLLNVVRQFSKQHHVMDMGAMARQAGTVVSAVMLGAIAGSGLLPFERRHFEQAIGQGAQAAASLRGFALAFDAVRTPLAPLAPLTSVVQQVLQDMQPAYDWLPDFPAAAHPWLRLGFARVCEYQNQAYGRVYLRRMRQLWQAEQTAPMVGLDQAVAADSPALGEITAETARWLALWMAFDDIIRVADLKSRASRWHRVHTEVKAAPDDVLQVYDHFKPGVPEFAALLPQAMANKLTAWDKRRILQGKEAWALPLKVGTHSVLGMLALRGLAACKAIRVYGARFQTEQAHIEQWLQAVQAGAARSANLGLELARCGRLIKGYGATNERGKNSLLHVVTHLAGMPLAEQAATAVAQARDAALADDAGKALDKVLSSHGAPARPVLEQPIRFMRKPKGWV